MNLSHISVHQIPYVLIQMLLHDPAEVPMLQNLGFNVQPGKHTSITIKPTKVHFLQTLVRFHVFEPLVKWQVSASIIIFCILVYNVLYI